MCGMVRPAAWFVSHIQGQEPGHWMTCKDVHPSCDVSEP